MPCAAELEPIAKWFRERRGRRNRGGTGGAPAGTPPGP